MADLSQLVGTSPLLGLLSSQEQAQAKERAMNQGLLNLGVALLQGSQGRPGQGRPRLGQIAATAVPAALQGYQGAFDQTLKDLVTSMQVKEAMDKRNREAQQQLAIQNYIATLPADQRARFSAFPTQAAEAMFREQPETFRQLSPDEVKSQGLPPGNYQISSKSGKVSPIGGEKVAINLSDPTAVGKEVRAIAADFTKELKDRGLTEVADRYRALDTSVRSALAGNRLAQGAIIYNVAKIYDPSGAVQEGDKATVLGNRSIPDSVRAIAQRVFEGGDLAPAEISALYSNVTKIVQDKAALVDPIKRNYAADIDALAPGRSSRLVSPFEGIRFGEAIGTTVRERQK